MINWTVRIKNPYFWIGLIATVLTAIGVSPECLTSWAILWDKIVSLAGNPFAIGCLIVAIIGYVNDPTTKGICDSKQALTYGEPKID